MSSDSCKLCPGVGKWMWLIMTAVALALCCAIFYTARRLNDSAEDAVDLRDTLSDTSEELKRKQMRRLLTPTKVLTNHLQLVNIFFLYDIDLPGYFIRIMDWIRMVMYLDLLSMASPECAVGQFPHWKRVIADACTPLAFMLIFVVIFLASGSCMSNEELSEKYRNQSVVAAVFIAIISFIFGVKIALEQFACTEYDDLGESRLTVAYEVECSHNKDYMVIVSLGVITMFVYVIVVIGSLLMIVVKAEERKKNAIEESGFSETLTARRRTTMIMTQDVKLEFEHFRTLGFDNRKSYIDFKNDEDKKSEFSALANLGIVRTKAEFDALKEFEKGEGGGTLEASWKSDLQEFRRKHQEYLSQKEELERESIAAGKKIKRKISFREQRRQSADDGDDADFLKKSRSLLEKNTLLREFRASESFEKAKQSRQKVDPFDTAADTIAGEFEDNFKWWFIVAQFMKILAVIAELYLKSGIAQVIFMLAIVLVCFVMTFRIRPVSSAKN